MRCRSMQKLDDRVYGGYMGNKQIQRDGGNPKTYFPENSRILTIMMQMKS